MILLSVKNLFYSYALFSMDLRTRWIHSGKQLDAIVYNDADSF